MGSSHSYSDGSAGFFRFRATDGTHSHICHVHVSFATVNDTSDPGSPTDGDNLINPEGDVNAAARNYLALLSQFYASTYTLSLLDFQGVSGGVPVGPPVPLLPYTLTGIRTGTGIPEAEISFTFRDSDGAPARFVVFGSSDIWNPATKVPLTPNWAGNSEQQFSAFLTKIARTGGVTYPANLSHIVSHHGLSPQVALAVVCGLNDRLRRSYRVK